MSNIDLTRRNFIKASALGATTIALPSIFPGKSNILAKTGQEMTFSPYPHPWMPEMTWVFTTNEHADPFKSPIKFTQDGIVVPRDVGDRKFAVNTRWFVEGFGFVELRADNGGEFYTAEGFSKRRQLNLNYEFAKSRVLQNRRVMNRYRKTGTEFSNEVKTLIALSDDYFQQADKLLGQGKACAKNADKALEYAMWAGEKIELEHARQQILKQAREQFYFGCETRQYIWAKSEAFTQRFEDLFNFATVTHYVWDTWYPVFEPTEGNHRWGIKDEIVDWLMENDITIQGRPMFWFHPDVTPEWLAQKSYPELLDYVERHATAMLNHYGDKVKQWSVINEYHDWANIHDHTPEQITEITRLACDTVKYVDPEVTRIINNCCPWAGYAAWGGSADGSTERQLRSPRKYLEDITNAEVDFDVIGLQMYFPRRDLAEIVRHVERFEKFGKPIYISEIGTSSGVTNESIQTGDEDISQEPYEWHRRWDEELQADWLEQLYTVLYARPSIEALNWYDFADFRTFIHNGGLIKVNGKRKKSYDRLHALLQQWNHLPG